MLRLALLLCLLAAPSLADEAAIARFDGFVGAVPPLCATAASTRCVEAAFAWADADADDGLTLDELERVRADLGHWLDARGATLSPTEAGYTRLGVWLVDSIGLEPLFRSYDADGDGRLTRTELTADLTLDARPLADVVLDPQAIDWPALRARLGALSAVLPTPVP